MFKSFIFIIFFILNLTSSNVFADLAPPPATPFNGCSNPNSCINEDSLADSIVKYAATLGVYDIIQKGFSMCSATAEGRAATFSDGSNGINCQVPTNNVTFDYQPSFAGISVGGGTGYSLTDGDSITIAGAYFRGSQQNDKICVQVWLAAAGYVNIGCKYAPNPYNGYSLNPGCYTGASCSNSALTNSQVLVPISSQVVQCVQETIGVIFTTPSACVNSDSSSGTAVNSFVNVQNGLRTAVRAALTLYVIFFGIKIALGQEIPKKGEVFMFLMKAILVMYFSVGIQNPATNTNGSITYTDGITTYIYPLLMNMGSTLSSIIESASSSNGLCLFDNSMYPTGYSYLKVWDMLDCRVGYYLGIYNPQGIAASATAVASMFLTIAMGLFFGAQILFAIIMAIIAVMILSFAVFFVNIYVVSLIAIAILLYFAPLFVPMALFAKTKNYFDSWARLALGYAIQPVVIMAFITLMFSVCDQLFYTGCGFTNISKDSKPYFSITDDQTKIPAGFTADSAACKASIGYKLSTITEDNFQPISFLFFKFNALIDGSFWGYIGKMMAMLLFLFLFYHFANIIAQFAADLTGTASLGGMAIKPNSIADKAGQIATMVADRFTGGVASKVKAAADEGVSATANGGKSDGTTVSRSGGTKSASSSESGINVSSADKSLRK